MTTQDSALTQGIAAAKAGDKGTARRLLSHAVQQVPNSEMAWLWLSAVLDTPKGRTFCLRRVLTLNPANLAAQRGLASLEQTAPARTLVAHTVGAQPLPTPVERSTATKPLSVLLRQLPSLAVLDRQRFWQITIAVLAIVALGLVGTLAYATVQGADTAQRGSIAAIVPAATRGPRSTLRPTFTPSLTPTPIPTLTTTPTATPTTTDTPAPTATSTFTPTTAPTATSSPSPTPTSPPRSAVRRIAPATATAPPTPRPTLPPRVWDPRLNALGVRIEPAPVAPGQRYWRLVEARWSDEHDSAGKHSIFIEALDLNGRRLVGQPVVIQWTGSSLVLPIENRPPPDWGANFPMYNTLGSYAVSVGGAPSDRIVGLGLGTAETPNFKVHTSFFLVFRLVRW